jgi:hypothetical protein
MEDLIGFVSQKAELPLPAAKIVASATLHYLTPHFSPLLKNTIEVLLQYPDLSGAERDILIATRTLFPSNAPSVNTSPRLDD